jgi:riboflavin synthase
MFTGIISAIGTIVSREPLTDGLRLTIAAPSTWLRDVALGDSIAHNGVCLTVTHKSPAHKSTASSRHYQVDVSGETLRCTTGFNAPLNTPINLEKALRTQDFIGGHLVSGHVDGVGKVTQFEALGESYFLEIRAPKALRPCIAPKGSITVDGVSLTVNRIRGRRFCINLIRHTLSATTLGRLHVGAEVNLEIDLIARYTARLLGLDA